MDFLSWFGWLLFLRGDHSRNRLSSLIEKRSREKVRLGRKTPRLIALRKLISDTLQYFAAAFSCKAPRMFDGSTFSAGCSCSADVAVAIFFGCSCSTSCAVTFFFGAFVIRGPVKHGPAVTVHLRFVGERRRKQTHHESVFDSSRPASCLGLVRLLSTLPNPAKRASEVLLSLS